MMQSDMRHTVHISIDDVERLFVDLIENQSKYSSAFENRELRYLERLHSKYGAKFTLYGYTRPGGRRLKEMPVSYRSDFESAASWLKFGFHWGSPKYDPLCQDDVVARDCNEFCECVESFAGEGSLTATIRLHYFHPSSSLIDKLLKLRWFGTGLTLLCADSPVRESYDLSPAELQDLAGRRVVDKEGRRYIPTDLRLENMVGCKIPPEMLKLRDMVVFTHEWALFEDSLRVLASRVLKRSPIPPSFLTRFKLDIAVKTLAHRDYEFIF